MPSRASEIQQICEERDIHFLCHFTRAENLDSILQQGLLGRSALEKSGQYFLFNDPDRVDGQENAVCLSVSFPNYLMFYKIRDQGRDEEVSDSQWAVLLLEPSVLWKFECAFCQENAAAGIILNIPLENLKTPEAFENMFIGDYTDNSGRRVLRDSLEIPENYPTHPQAEVLVFDPIPTQYIKAICFENADARDAARSNWESSGIDTVHRIRFFTGTQYFKPRPDFKKWRSDNGDGNEAESDLDFDDEIPF